MPKNNLKNHVHFGGNSGHELLNLTINSLSSAVVSSTVMLWLRWQIFGSCCFTRCHCKVGRNWWYLWCLWRLGRLLLRQQEQWWRMAIVNGRIRLWNQRGCSWIRQPMNMKKNSTSLLFLRYSSFSFISQSELSKQKHPKVPHAFANFCFQLLVKCLLGLVW